MNGEDIFTKNGPILLLAGPGTGKTHKLAERIKYLVEDAGISPDRITVLTFTNQAAINMRRRLSNVEKRNLYLPGAQHPKRISTLHSLGHTVITDCSQKLKLPRKVAIVKDRIREIIVRDAAQLSGFTSEAADAVVQCRQFGNCQPGREDNCEICYKYREITLACGAVDHDDQILLAYQLLSEDNALLNEYQSEATHLLIDEYQDINPGQFRLIKLLSGGQEEGLFVVGDDDQSIYSWRGGSPEFIRNFRRDFGPEAKIKPLLISYRCPKNFFESALAVVKAFDPDWVDKGELDYDCPDSPKTRIYSVPNEKREASIILRIVENALPSNSVLILVPRRPFSGEITRRLRMARIPYAAMEPLPGKGFAILERLATWIADPDDSIALRDVIEAMVDGKKLDVPSKRVTDPKKVKKRDEVYLKICRLWEYVLGERKSLWEGLEINAASDVTLGEIHKVCRDLRASYDKDVPGFLKLATGYLNPWASKGTLLEEITGWVNRSGITTGLGVPTSVQIMTLQSAKGLEADVVCIVGLEEGTIPSRTAGDTAIAEQSRLLFVSMTRAKRELHLFSARQRSGSVSYENIHARGRSHCLTRSRFLSSISEEFSEEIYVASKKH